MRRGEWEVSGEWLDPARRPRHPDAFESLEVAGARAERGEGGCCSAYEGSKGARASGGLGVKAISMDSVCVSVRR